MSATQQSSASSALNVEPTPAVAHVEAHQGLELDHRAISWIDSSDGPIEQTQEHSAAATTHHDRASTSDKDGGGMHALVSGFKSLGRGIKEVGSSIKSQAAIVGELFKLNQHVSQDLTDTHLYPELEWEATLRRNNDLCHQEVAFRIARRKFIASSGVLHRFLGLDPHEVVHLEDVPEIGFGGSGGGYRACLGFLSMVQQIQDPSLQIWDLITYIAGVSGSCWSIASLYTFSHLDAQEILDHLAKGSAKHPLSASAINTVARSTQGIYFQLSPLLLKIKRGIVHPTPLDLYGTLTTTHIFFSPGVKAMAAAEHKAAQEHQDEPHGHLKKEWFKFSRCSQTMGLEQGRNPLPIFTAVRHERPWKDWKSPEDEEEEASIIASSQRSQEPATGVATQTESSSNNKAWWQWWSFTPFEFGSDELEAWIPMWSFGRKFEKGRSTEKIPELSLSLVLGLCTSAPAGPLSAYLSTIYRNLPSGMFGDTIRKWSDNWTRKHAKSAEKFQNHHPVHAQNEPNPIFGAEKVPGRGHGFENSPRIHLVDAGMSNNQPHTIFFRPGRQPDVILLGDYSSDVQKGNAAIDRIADGLKPRGLKVVPRHPLDPLPPWPMQPVGTSVEGEAAESKEKKKPKLEPKRLTAAQVAERYKGRYGQLLDATLMTDDKIGPTTIDDDATTRDKMNQRNVPQARKGCTIVYLPLLPHAVQPDYDPSTADFSSSYNLVWTQEQVEIIARTAKANLLEAVPTIRDAVREAYYAKKRDRLAVGALPQQPQLKIPSS